MRILQIIDSLEAGGAERMAVNYANALSKQLEFSGVVATRKEGPLKDEINSNVGYVFLNKKKAVDFIAVFKLVGYCKKNKIDYLQAHTSSFFIAVLVKILNPKIKIIWHDHYGLSEFLNERKVGAIKTASFFFNGIIVVNYQLKNWAETKLNCKKVIYLPNFTNKVENELSETQLKGENGKRILCLANLRPQKNHFLLLKIAERIKNEYPDWTFHLVGKDFNDNYSEAVRRKIEEKQLQNNVFVYGSKKDIQSIINQSDIAVLASKSEGLPISLLEYGLHKKAVISTQVGEIPMIIKNNENGFIVDKDDEDQFLKYTEELIQNPSVREQFGNSLYETILKNNSEEAIIKSYLNWIAKL